MSSKSTSNVKPSSEEKGKLMLLFGKANNFPQWKLCQIDICVKEFGFQANVLKNNVAYVPPAVTAADYTPAMLEGEPALTAAAITSLRVDAERQRNKEISKLKQNAPNFYATLWESLSIESKEEVSQHEDFVAADIAADPNVLYSIIRQTHLTAIHGVGLGALELVNLKNKLSHLRQKPNVSIGEFKKDFDLQIDVLRGAGVADTPQPELAMMFLTKLDPMRYASMLAQLTNDATLGREFPQTLHKAWTVASAWKSASTKIAGGSDMNSVFVLADDARSNDAAAGRGSKQASRQYLPAQRHGRGVDSLQRLPSPQATKRPALSAGGQAETRTCRGCLRKGHLWKDCPDNISDSGTSNVMLAAGEDDDADIFGSTFMVKDNESGGSIILFSDTEVLLDNQAGRSIFRNRDLLTDVLHRWNRWRVARLVHW